MRTIGLILVMVLAGCGGDEDDSAGNPEIPDANTTPAIGFTPFQPNTRSFDLGEFDSNHYLSITSASGLIACGLPSNPNNGLGRAGFQVIMNVTPAVGVPCPTGTYSVPGDCPADFDRQFPTIREGCAYFREWAADGTELGVLRATAGAVEITGNEQSCSFGVEMFFEGQTFGDSFTLTNGLVADPWCSN